MERPKQQVVIIGGGNTFESYAKYLSCLENNEINIERLKPFSDWKNTLQKKLGRNFEVFAPRMPNTTNAQYPEWKIWFKRILGVLGYDLIIIGHSLGGVFLAKYFSENDAVRTIDAAILIAAPFDDEGGDEKLATFALTLSLEKFASQAGQIYLMYSKDDRLVDISQMQKYQFALPMAKAIAFDGRGHFNQETFPELVKLIKTIS